MIKSLFDMPIVEVINPIPIVRESTYYAQKYAGLRISHITRSMIIYDIEDLKARRDYSGDTSNIGMAVAVLTQYLEQVDAVINKGKEDARRKARDEGRPIIYD